MNMNLNDNAEGADREDLGLQISDVKADGGAIVGDVQRQDCTLPSAIRTTAPACGKTKRRASAAFLRRHKRWGKIARMPLEVRDWLNEQMRDGMKYADLSAGLKGKGFEGVTKFDLSDWRHGGHQEWLEDQERMAVLRDDVGRVVKAAAELSEEAADGLDRLNDLLIGMQVVRALQDLHRGTMKDLVSAKPELLFRVAKVASDQARDRARRKRANVVVKKYDDVVAEKKGGPYHSMQVGLTPEMLKEIEAAMARF
jgi:hypothetical protein